MSISVEFPSPPCPKDSAELVQRRVTVRIKGIEQLSCGAGFNRGDSSACRADKVKEGVRERYKIMTDLEKMNREGDSGSSDPRTREVPNKPANDMWDRNKMR